MTDDDMTQDGKDADDLPNGSGEGSTDDSGGDSTSGGAPEK